MQGFNVDEMQNRKDINAICSDLNKLVRKRHNARSKENIECDIERQCEILANAYQNATTDTNEGNSAIKNDEERLDRQCDDVNFEKEPMTALLHSDRRSTKYYTVISKEKAREEIAGLVDYYPEHSFYAVTDTIDDEGEECFTVVMGEGEDNPFGYYPELDSAKTEAERKNIMEQFLSGFEEYYIYSKPIDFFAR